MTTENNQNSAAEDYNFTILDLLRQCLAKWYWFVLSLVLCALIAAAYILTTPPVYERRAAVLIKDESKSKSPTVDVSGLSELGLFQSQANVNNEIVYFRAHDLMTEVVRRLHLDVEYKIPGRFHDEVLYGSTLPVDVRFDSVGVVYAGQSRRFVVTLSEGGRVALSGFSIDGEEVGPAREVSGAMLDTLATPLGRIVVRPTAYYAPASDFPPIEVTRRDPSSVAHSYSENLTVGLNAKETTIIEIALRDVSARRAEEVVSTLIAVYNENWVKDKNRIAVNTSRFINERLSVIESELGDVDQNIAAFKSANLVPDVAAASAMYMSRSNEVAGELQALNNHLQMARYILRYMTDHDETDQLLPASSGIESSSIEGQISEYNTMLLRRNNLVSNSSTQNPLVVELDRSLAARRRAIVTSVENYISTLDEQIRGQQTVARQTTTQISRAPTQAKALLSVERQQMVKEALYLFLLQKREENELLQTFAADNTRIVQAPTGSVKAIAPVRRNILAIAIFIGLVIPAAVIFLRETMNTTVHGRKDLERLTVPIIGEIPLIEARRMTPRRKRSSAENIAIVVEYGKRDVVNEAFRVLRTNLEFIKGQQDGCNVIGVTSFNAGSGKSLLSINIAAGLAVKGRKVLVVDGDMRHASISKLQDSPSTGLSNLLAGKVARPEDCIAIDKQNHDVHVLPVGTIPPNPTELLENGRLGQIIASQRDKYDYILVDCPPIDIVADTQIIEQHLDRTVFVVRAGLLERAMLPELEAIYTARRFKNMVAVLNATPLGKGRYGYLYGYHSGYHNS